MKIGKNIKAIRVSQKMEQKELAEKLHISNKTISSWECDRTEPNIGMFERIADALNVTKAELLEGKKKPTETFTVGEIRIVEANESNGNKGYIISDLNVLSKEEQELIRMYRLHEYKKLVNKIMEKI